MTTEQLIKHLEAELITTKQKLDTATWTVDMLTQQLVKTQHELGELLKHNEH